MIKNLFSLTIGFSLLLTLFCPNTNALLIDQAFFYRVTSVDNPSFWGWDVGDYIPGHAIYDDADIPATGRWEIGYGYDPSDESVAQLFQLTIDLRKWTLTERDDTDFGPFPILEFLNGKLYALNFMNPEAEALGHHGLQKFSFKENSYLQSKYPKYTLQGHFELGPESAVSEPATLMLLGSGLVGFAIICRKRFKNNWI